MTHHDQFIGRDEPRLDAVSRDLKLHWLACSVLRSASPLNAAASPCASLRLVFRVARLVCLPNLVQVRCERLHDVVVLAPILPCASHLRYALLHQARAVVLLLLLVLQVFVLLLPVLVLPVFVLLPVLVLLPVFVLLPVLVLPDLVLLPVLLLPVFVLLLPVLVQPVVVVAAEMQVLK